MNRTVFPFTALVGQEEMKSCLLLNAVDPAVGGVLIRGQKGTGKTTAVRAMAALLPEITVVENCPYNCSPHDPLLMHEDCLRRYQQGETLKPITRPMPLVELPLNTTEDRLAGSLHLEKVLATGRRYFEPGLLAAANRGLFYVDEVNLLEDHLVDFLLDAAASGFHRVEREGLSVTHPSRFILVGTMNPEEGELRPQFLDRFGLCVDVKTSSNHAQRVKILKRNIQFTNDPQIFIRSWQQEENNLSRRIQSAKKRLSQVQLPDSAYELVVALAVKADVHGHRAEITMIRAARALSALMERDQVLSDTVLEAAIYVLPHRLRTNEIMDIQETHNRVKKIIEQTVRKPFPTQAGPVAVGAQLGSEDSFAGNPGDFPEGTLSFAYDDAELAVPGSAAAGNLLFPYLKKKTKKIFLGAAHGSNILSLKKALARWERTARDSRHNAPSSSAAASGRYITALPVKKSDRSFHVAINPSFKTFAIRQLNKKPIPFPWRLKRDDLYKQIKRKTRGHLLLFIVDISDSMGKEKRLTSARDALLALLRYSYRKRVKVGLVVFNERQARVILNPTKSVTLVLNRLNRLNGGGATPMADGFLKAWSMIKNQRRKSSGIIPRIILISDGEANVALVKEHDPEKELLNLAQKLKADKIACLLINTAFHSKQQGFMKKLAQVLDGSYHYVDQINAGTIFQQLY